MLKIAEPPANFEGKAQQAIYNFTGKGKYIALLCKNLLHEHKLKRSNNSRAN